MAKNINPAQIERLKQLLELGNVKKADLSRIAEVTPQAVNNWFKTGLISKDSANKIATALEISLDWLLYGEGSEPLNQTSVRRQKLGEWFEKNQPAQHEKSYIQQLISGSGAFSPLVARRLEKDYGMPHMYLDSPPSPEIRNNQLTLTAQEREILGYFQRFPDSTKEEMLNLFREKAESFDRLFKELYKLRGL